MELRDDLDLQAIEHALPGRPVRSYPALLSTEAEATAWARGGGEGGSLVVADYQISPRGRAGIPWEVTLGEGLCFSLVMRPDLIPDREGWPYIVASLGISDVLGGDDTRLRWPDLIEGANGESLAAVGFVVQLGPENTDWAVATVQVISASPPRVPLLVAVVEAIEQRATQAPTEVLEAYKSRCTTLGENVRARMIPLGAAGPQVVGTAADVLDDGALVLLTERENRVAVRPQNLGILEPAGEQARLAEDLWP